MFLQLIQELLIYNRCTTDVPTCISGVLCKLEHFELEICRGDDELAVLSVGFVAFEILEINSQLVSFDDVNQCSASLPVDIGRSRKITTWGSQLLYLRAFTAVKFRHGGYVIFTIRKIVKKIRYHIRCNKFCVNIWNGSKVTTA